MKLSRSNLLTPMYVTLTFVILVVISRTPVQADNSTITSKPETKAEEPTIIEPIDDPKVTDDKTVASKNDTVISIDDTEASDDDKMTEAAVTTESGSTRSEDDG